MIVFIIIYINYLLLCYPSSAPLRGGGFLIHYFLGDGELYILIVIPVFVFILLITFCSYSVPAFYYHLVSP